MCSPLSKTFLRSWDDMGSLVVSHLLLWGFNIVLFYMVFKLMKTVQNVSKNIQNVNTKDPNMIGPPIGSPAKPLGDMKLSNEETLILFFSTGCHFCKSVINDLPKLREEYSNIIVLIKDDDKKIYEEYESKISSYHMKCKRLTEQIYLDYVIKGFPFGIITKKQRIVSKGPASSLKAIEEFRKAG
jgi:thiol-disulfide isomerase/thioredoxin